MDVSTSVRDKTRPELIEELEALRRQLAELDTTDAARSLRRAERARSVVFEIFRATSESHNLKELLGIIHHKLGMLLDATNFYVALYDGSNDTYTFPYSVDEFDTDDNITPQQMKRSLTDFVRRTREPLFADQEVHQRLIDAGEVDLVGAPAKVWMGVPLRSTAGVTGVVAVQSYLERSPYTEDDLELLRFVSGNIAIAIERKQAEEALQESEDRYRTVSELTSDFAYAYRVGEDGTPLCEWVTAAFARITGYDADKLKIPGGWDSMVYPEDLPVVEGQERTMLGGQKTVVEYRILTRNGQVRWLRDHGLPEFDVKAKRVIRFIGAVQDITDQRRAEKERLSLETQLRESKKMECVGRLAGGVAHDFNNLLMPILCYSEMLVSGLAPGSPRYAELAEIQKAAKRARELAAQLLAFGRKQVLELKPISLSLVLGGIKKIIRPVIREDIDLQVRFQPSMGTINADVTQIETIIVNLALNAQDAMPGGGKLIIEAEDVLLDIVHTETHPGSTAGPHSMLAISDSGRGMDKETLAHAFEPFFTTKGPGKGTGLGLAMVYGIVRQHGGHIWVYSEPGQGTTFKIYIPRADKTPEETGKYVKELKSLCGSETIVVVEDNDSVRRLVCRMLKKHGYGVVDAGSAGECLYILEQHDGPVHLLLTDVVMPQMNGRELYAQLSTTLPDLKVLYMSGHNNDVIAHHGILDAGVHLIQKPFTMKKLALKLREILDPPQSPTPPSP